MALRTARFYHHESCGKCTPCREGTNWTVKMLERMVRGEATPMDLDIVSSVQENIIGNCLCVLGDSMAMPVGAMVKKFRGEFEMVMAEQGAQSPGMPGRIPAKPGSPVADAPWEDMPGIGSAQPAAGPGHGLTPPGPAAGPGGQVGSPL
jgi:hypothetical protein